MRVVFFEDDKAGQLAPIARLRPVFELLCGATSVRERVLGWLGSGSWGALVRPELCDVYREQCPDAVVNDPIALHKGATLLINGRWLPDSDALQQVSRDNVGMVGDQIAWLQIDGSEAVLLEDTDWSRGVSQIARSRHDRVQAAGPMIEYPWDVVAHNRRQLEIDLSSVHHERPDLAEHVVVMGENVSVHPDAEVEPFVVLDSRSGPIRIEAGARIQSFTRIEGPCYIGRDSQLFRALVGPGTTIGPVCRVGGELEECVLHGFVNKYHTGFLGHSYVCPWVNLGALSTTSDLKNDYSTVSVPLEGTAIDSGHNKVGSFIGDHAKTAINSMFNTGSSIGAMAMVLPGGPLLPRHIPPFSVIWFGQVRDTWGIDRSLETARVAMGRRGRTLTPAAEKLLRWLHEQTAAQRADCVRKHSRREAATR